MSACPWEATSPDECAMMRERSVAGISDEIPPCPVHPETSRADDVAAYLAGVIRDGVALHHERSRKT